MKRTHLLTNIKYATAIAVVGVFLSVVAAWLSGMFGHRIYLQPVQPCDSWPVSVPSDWPEHPTTCSLGSRFYVSVALSGSGYEAVPTVSGQRFSASVLRYGYPFKSMESRSMMSITSLGAIEMASGVEQGLIFPSWVPGPQSGLRRMALLPVPIPFIANTLIYSLIMFLVAWSLNAARGYRRKAQGRCKRCGYSLLDFKRCPECGSFGDR